METPTSRTSSNTRETTSQVDTDCDQSSRVQDLERIARHFLGHSGTAPLDDSDIRHAVEEITNLSRDRGNDSEQGIQNSGPSAEEESFDTRFVSKVTARKSDYVCSASFAYRIMLTFARLLR